VVVVPVITTNVLISYVDTFANVVTNHYHANSTETLLTVTVGPLNGAPAGSPLQTNSTAVSVTIPGLPSGDFYINTNACGPNLILQDLLDTATATTNLIVVASNSAGLFFSQSSVSFSNSSALIVEPIVCGAVSGGGTTTNSPGLYEGIGDIQFVKTTFDSLIGNFWQPVTNTYTQVLIINSKPVKQTFQRVVTQPDLLFTAADLLPGPGAVNTLNPRYSRNINFDMSNIGTGLAGPGVITNPTTITFNKVGPVYFNIGPGGLFQANGIVDSFFVWGSFDGSTNDPVVYPDGTSLANLASQVLVQISPVTLPTGTNGMAYPATTFVATGGAFSAPFTWSLSSGGLPLGLTLSSTGTISGKPTQTGTFDFTLQMTDSLSRSVSWSYSITIN
jgi:Putative Ig domain